MSSIILSMLESKKDFKDMNLELWEAVESEASFNELNTHHKEKDSAKVLIVEFRKEDLSSRQDTMLKAQSVENKKFSHNVIS